MHIASTHTLIRTRTLAHSFPVWPLLEDTAVDRKSSWFSSEPSSSLAEPSCSVRTWQTCVFPVHLCLSGLQPHTILTPVSAAKNKAETNKRSMACSQPHGGWATPRLHTTSPFYLSYSGWPCFSPMTLGVKAIWASRLRKGKAHRFERWLVSVYRKRVPEMHPRKFPTHTHPTQDLPSQVLGEAKLRNFRL